MEDFDDIELINDLASASDASAGVASALEVSVGVATPANLQMIHEDIQSLHWSIVCIFIICMFCWICKQWG